MGVLLALCLLLSGVGPLTSADASIMPTQEWVSRYTGPANTNGSTYRQVVDAAGNVSIYLAGTALASNGHTDIVTAKFNGATGEQLWTARYDGTASGDDRPVGLAVDSAGDVIVAGASASSYTMPPGTGTFTDVEYAAIKYSGTSGQPMWVAHYASSFHFGDSIPTALALDGRGNAFVTGTTFNGGTGSTVKFDGATGQQLFVAAYNGGHDSNNLFNTPISLAVNGAGDFYIIANQGWQDPRVFRTWTYSATVKYSGATGQLLWESANPRSFQGQNPVSQLGLDAAGNPIVVGYTSPIFGGDTQMYTVKYNGGTGSGLWLAQYGSSNVTPFSLAVDAGGNAFVGTSFGSFVKYDAGSGAKLWESFPAGNRIPAGLDDAGNLYLTGNVGATSQLVAKCDGGTGRILWQTLYSGDRISAVTLDSGGNVYVTGSATRAGGTADYATAKYRQTAIPTPVVTITDLTATSAVLNWTTSQPTSSFLRVGPAPDSLFSLTDSSFVTNHRMAVTLFGGAPGALTYYYITAGLPDSTSFELATGTVTAASTFTITGKVTVAGAGVGGVQVIGAGENVTTAADGTYTLTAAHAGYFLVQAFAVGYTFPDQTVLVGPSQTGVNFDAPARISGKVTVGGVGFGGAQVIGAGQSVTTAADGTYSLTGVGAGYYRVQAFAIGYTFADQTVQVGPSKAGVDFAAPANPALTGSYTISGQVTAGGAGVGGVVVSGAGQTVFTNADGTYALTNVGTGNYEIVAWAPEYTFASPSRTVQVGPSQSRVDFTGVRKTYTISGKVTVAGASLASAVVFAGGTTALTAADGTYTLTGLVAGSYGVHAFAADHTFPDQTVVVGPSQSGVDFDTPATISGRVTVAGAGLGGVQVIGAGQNVTTAADGTYTLTGVHAGYFLVQAFAAGYSFPDRTVLVGPDQTGVDFDAPATISGRVTVGGVGLAGVQVIGAGQNVLTAADGSYMLTGVHAGYFLVQAFAAGYTFPDQTVLVGPSKSGVDFAAQ